MCGLGSCLPRYWAQNRQLHETFISKEEHSVRSAEIGVHYGLTDVKVRRVGLA